MRRSQRPPASFYLFSPRIPNPDEEEPLLPLPGTIAERFVTGLAGDVPRICLREFMVSESYLTEDIFQALIRLLPQVTSLFLHELYTWKASPESSTVLQNFAALSLGGEGGGGSGMAMEGQKLCIFGIHRVWNVTEAAGSPNSIFQLNLSNTARIGKRRRIASTIWTRLNIYFYSSSIRGNVAVDE